MKTYELIATVPATLSRSLRGGVARASLLGAMALVLGGALGGYTTAAYAQVGGELQVIAWEGYDLAKELADWRKQHNVTLQSSSMTSQDDVHTKFLAGNPPPIDLAEYNQAYADLYIKQMKIVKPLDLSKVPNYNADNLFSVFFQKPTWSSDGKTWAVPYMWGVNTILYNSGKVAKPTSYTDLLKPEFKGKIAIMDDTTSSWPVAARVSGFGAKYPLLTKNELKQAFKEFTKYRSQARLIALNQGDLANFMASGEVVAALCADPSIIPQVEAQGITVEMSIPKEGAVLWVDALFVPISTDNEDTALAYLNQALDPKIQAQVASAVVQAPTSKKALEYMSEKDRKRFDYDNLEQIFSAGLPGIPPVESDGVHATYDDWVAAWQEFKAGM